MALRLGNGYCLGQTQQFMLSQGLGGGGGTMNKGAPIAHMPKSDESESESPSWRSKRP